MQKRKPKRKAGRSQRPANYPLVAPGALKLPAASAYLSISQPSLRRVVERGLIRPSRGLRHLLFSLRELDRYLAESISE
jgi:hypothetical protein